VVEQPSQRNSNSAASWLPAPARSRCRNASASFGVSALPRFHLELLAWLGERIEVHLFRLEPCCQYWSDIRTRKQQERSLARLGRSATDAEAFHFETGNRLLASLGQAGRSFQDLLLDSGDWQAEDDFRPPGTDTLLHALQDDILHLRDRGASAAVVPLAIAREDHSLLIHSCHSPLREVEVLHDHLLDWFQRDPTLQPREVLVMTTDIEAYAPAIQAVFESPETESQRIPFSLADRAARRESRVADTFLRILALPDTRLTAPEVLAPLETPAVLARFGLAESDLELLRRWVRETNIRWGRDAAHKAALGLPALAENTWRQGLDRLLLGYALPGNGEQLFEGLLPYSEVEGEAADTLGHFCEYCAALFEAVDALAQPRSLAGWQEFLTALLDRFFLEDEESADELGVTRAALAELRREAALAGFGEFVPLSVLQETLAATLEEERYRSGFLTGGVTCCALKPMRSIPFRVVCVLGLNDGVFPRSDARLSFDLMAAQPQPGDRSARAEDRYLFLETLLSARDRLHLSYVGQSLADNSVIPPSVVISELLDTVRQGFVLAEDASPDALENHLVVKHRLHAFSAAYFAGEDARFFSFSAQNLTASRVAAAGRNALRPFVPAPLVEPEAEFRLVDVDALIQFFTNPCKFLLTRRLGLRLPREDAALADREPFDIAGLEQFKLQEELVATRLAGGALDDARAELLRAAGRLPPGVSGSVWFAAQRELAATLAAKASEHAGGQPMTRREVDFPLGDFRVRGSVPNVFGAQLLAWKSVKKATAKDLLRLWISLLAVNAAHDGSPLTGGCVLARGEEVVLAAPQAAPAELAKLLQLYWTGLRRPLPFFPRSSFAFARPHREGKDPLEAARAEWLGDPDYGHPGECEDKWFHQCFRHGEPLDREFEETAVAVFGPLLAGEAE
jgi:exodeoxyribonuclease V gamma subunit